MSFGTVTRRVMMAVALTLTLMAALPLSALAGPVVYDPALGPVYTVSATNPSAGTAGWRRGWGRSVWPHFAWQNIKDARGMLYVIDRTAVSPVNPATPLLYSHAVFPEVGGTVGGTQFSETIDLLGVLAFPPVGGWSVTPGATSPLEGDWYLHYKLYGTNDISGAPIWDVDPAGQQPFHVGIDVTPPNPVLNVAVQPAVSVAASTNVLSSTSRVLVSWQGQNYDALAGTAYFRIYDNGRLLMTGDSASDLPPESLAASLVVVPMDSLATPTPVPERGPVWYTASWGLPYRTTFENMEPGVHVIQMSNVDRAGNESTKSAAAVFVSDPDTPTIKWVAPTVSTIGTSVELQVDAADAGGVARVVYAIGGTKVGTSTVAPYSLAADLSLFSNGPHVLTATVYDLYGRSASTSYPFVLNKSMGALVGTTDLITFPEEGGVFGSTTTNPNAGDKVWRKGWGKSLFPEITIDGVHGADGIYYELDRDMLGSIDVNNLGRASHALFGTPSSGGIGTHLEHTIDLNGYYSYPPVGGWGPATPGASDPREGIWYLHVAYYAIEASSHDMSFAPTQTTIPFGIDITDPGAVQNVLVSPDQSVPPATSAAAASQKVDISWTGADYDALSGGAYFRIYVDDVLTFTGDSADGAESVSEHLVTVPVDNSLDPPLLERAPIWFVPSWTRGYGLTIESLSAGAHRIQVSTVDRAGNESTKSAPAVFFSDPDVPTIKWVAPTASTIGTSVELKVDAADAGGVVRVVYAIGGTNVGTSTVAPFSLDADLSPFSDGPHTLTATVYDTMGRTASASYSFTLDRTQGVLVGTTDLITFPEDGGVHGSTTTNPNAGSKVWRQGWGKSLFPEITIDGVNGADGIYYTLDRSPVAPIDVNDLGSYSHALLPAPSAGGIGTHLDHTIDLDSYFMYPPAGGWGPAIPGAANPREGVWYLHVAYYAIDRTTRDLSFSPTQTTIPIKLDITAPSAVQDVLVSPDDSVTPTRSVAGGGGRVNISWRGSDYDALSGGAFFRVYVDGALTFTGDSAEGVENIAEGLVVFPVDDSVDPPLVERAPIWFVPSWTRGYGMTIENLSGGSHTIQVTQVDRAGNESGVSSSARFFSDPDIPQIELSEPIGSTIGRTPRIVVFAADQAAVTRVVFRLDGTTIGVSTVPIEGDAYLCSPDLADFADGGHTLSATAYDTVGHTATVSKSITLDKTPPTITKISAGPNPFYPIERDGYRDNSAIKFTLAERCSVAVRVYTSKGALVRTLTATKNAGANSLTWNGKKSNGAYASPGSYYYVIRATDSIGNTRQSARIGTKVLRRGTTSAPYRPGGYL